MAMASQFNRALAIGSGELLTDVVQLQRKDGTMKRRDFPRSTGIASASLVLPNAGRLFGEGATSGSWRRFEVTPRVEILKPSGATRIWLPAALTSDTPFQRTLSNRVSTEGGTANIVEDRADALGIIAAEFRAGVKPALTLTSRIATRNYTVVVSAAGTGPKEDPAALQHWLRPTKLLPTDGIVKETASDITRGAETDVDKALAIYEWIVENTFRDPKTRGCGVGDIRFMLVSKDLGGKCADLNALYVGLPRPLGLPAPDAYGLPFPKSS